MRERLLTRHFLRRFLENDLISPDADRHEILSVAGAAIISLGLFGSVLLSVKYLFRPFQSPGWTSVAALDDTFLFAACSMIGSALIAVATWDALPLDGRDAAILGPLPLPRGVVVRAKLSALVVFAAGFAFALNFAPSVVHPSLVVAKLPATVWTPVALIGAHVVSTMAAGAFGFAAVLGIRELLQAFLGTSGFRRVSMLVQAGLLVFLVAALLLTPRLSWNVADAWLAASPLNVHTVPPLWFVGLHETIGGQVLDQLPRPELPPGVREVEDEATRVYRSYRGLFGDLARTAVAVPAVVVLLALVAYVWNGRRLPAPPVARRAGASRLSRTLIFIAQRFLARRPALQAGFFFTIQTLGRSLPHRFSIAMSFAGGLAVAAVSLTGTGGRAAFDPASGPIAVFAVQTVLIGALLAAFRHSIRIPADLRASWIFHLAWLGDERPYLAGTKRAALTVLIAPALAALIPIHALLVGWRVAVSHGAFGLALALVVREAALLGFRKLPFVCSYIPNAQVKTLGPIYAFVVLVSVYAVAWIERIALGSVRGTIVLLGLMAAIAVALRVVDIRQRRTRFAIEVDDVPESATQRLGLSG